MGVGNSVTVVVDAQNKTATAFGDAAKGAKTVGDAAAIADRQLKDMGQKLDEANIKARRLAEAEERAAAKAREMAEKLVILKTQLAESGDESGKLSRRIDRLGIDLRSAANATDDYRRAGNRAAEVAREQARAYDRVADNARQAARAVALLGASSVLSPSGGGRAGSALSSLPGVVGGAAAGAVGGGAKIGTGAASGLASTPYVGPIAVGAGAIAAGAAAPFAGGVIGGGAALGAGAAGAGLGLAGAWMGDPTKYSGLWNKAIDGIQQRWLASSSAFGAELESGLKIVDRTLRDLPVEKILAVSHGISGPLLEGASGGITQAALGFAELAAQGEKVANVVGPKLEGLGHDVGDAMRAIAMGSEGGSEALGDFVDVTGTVVKATGIMILGLEDAYHSMREGAKTFETNLTSIFDTIGGPGAGAGIKGMARDFIGIQSSGISAGRALYGVESAGHGAADSLAATAAAAARAAVGVISLNDSLTENRSLMMSLGDANLAVAQGWLDLNEGLKDGAKTLDTTKQAGIDNARVIEQQIGLLERQRTQAITTAGDNADAIATANEAYEAGIDKLKKMAHAAGFTDAEVDRLIATYGGIPPTAQTEIKTPGMGQALDQSASLGQRLNQIDRDYVARIRVTGLAEALAAAARASAALSNIGSGSKGNSQGGGMRTGGIPHAAGGGSRSGLTMVGEEGIELARLPQGTMVYPHANAMQAQTMAGWGGGGGGPLLIGSDGSQLGDLLVDVICAAVKGRGGDPGLLGIKSRR